MSALELVNIRKRYGTVETLKGIDLSLASGEFLVLLGSSGCGKSTLLNIIAGLAEATDGDVRIGDRVGHRGSSQGPRYRHGVPVLRALSEHVGGPQHRLWSGDAQGPGGRARRRRCRRPPGSCRSRIFLTASHRSFPVASASASPSAGRWCAIPQIFLFDEPLSNLDAKLRMEMRTELKRLHQMLGTTIVYVTHDQIEAMTLATRIAVMRDGQIEQLAAPDEIYNRPATRYVASFVGSPPMNMLDATVADGIAHIDGSLSSIPLPRELQESAGKARNVIVGIRPENLTLASGDDIGLAIEAKVEVVELTGPELVVTSTIGSQRLTASLPPRSQVTVGMLQRFSIDASALHVFDKVTEKRI